MYLLGDQNDQTHQEEILQIIKNSEILENRLYSKLEQEIYQFLSPQAINHPDPLNFTTRFAAISNLKEPELEMIEYIYILILTVNNKITTQYNSKEIAAACCLYYKILRNNKDLEKSLTSSIEGSPVGGEFLTWGQVLASSDHGSNSGASETLAQPITPKVTQIRNQIETRSEQISSTTQQKTRKYWSVIEEFYTGYSFKELLPLREVHF